MSSTLGPMATSLAAACFLLTVAGAGAQTSTPTPMPSGPVTDTAPPAAEERDSTGAVVLEKSMVPAQREKARQEAGKEASRPTPPQRIGRDASRLMGHQKAQGERDAAGREDTERLRGEGAGGLTEK